MPDNSFPSQNVSYSKALSSMPRSSRPPRMSTGGKTPRHNPIANNIPIAPPPPYTSVVEHVIPRRDHSSPVSHLLMTCLKFSEASTCAEQEDLRRDFIAFMATCSHTFSQNEDPVTLRWASSDGGQTFTTFSPLSEEYVRMLTEKRLVEFSSLPVAKAATGLEYFVAKNLSFTFSLTHGRAEMNNGVQNLLIQ